MGVWQRERTLLARFGCFMEMKVKHAVVRGTTTADALHPNRDFTAEVELELRADCVYYM